MVDQESKKKVIILISNFYVVHTQNNGRSSINVEQNVFESDEEIKLGIVVSSEL